MLLLACLHRPPAVVHSVEHVAGFKIEILGSTLAGTGVFAEEGDAVVFQALTPAGTALFSVRDSGTAQPQVVAPDEDLAAMLERLPWYRDLSLLFRWSCPEGRCTTETGRIRESEDSRRYRGDGGPATVRILDDGLELTDPRRRYTLTVLK